MNATIKQRGLGVVLRFNAELEPKVVEACATGMKRGLAHAVTVAQREFLSGPRPAKLDIITGRLRNAMSYAVRVREGKGVIGRLGNNVKYAAYHEFGFHGTVNVASHLRVIKQLNNIGVAIDTRRVVRKADGSQARFLDTRKAALSRTKTGVAVIQRVGAHTRKVDYAGRPFAGPALKKAGPVILKQIVQELRKIQPPPTT